MLSIKFITSGFVAKIPMNELKPMFSLVLNLL